MANHPNRKIRYFLANIGTHRYLGRANDAALRFVCLRDIGGRVLSGEMFRTEDEAKSAAERKAGPFDGVLIGIAPLREVSAAEAEEIGAQMAADSVLYRQAFRR